jgi:hypothetical protein
MGAAMYRPVSVCSRLLHVPPEPGKATLTTPAAALDVSTRAVEGLQTELLSDHPTEHSVARLHAVVDSTTKIPNPRTNTVKTWPEHKIDAVVRLPFKRFSDGSGGLH